MPVNITTITGTCRKFNNFDLAFLWLRRREDHLKYMFQGPDDFKRLNAKGREAMWPRFKEWSVFRWKEDRVCEWNDFVAMDGEAQNKYLWRMVNNIADPVTVRPQFFMTGDGIEVNLILCEKLLGQAEWNMVDLRAPHLPSRMRKPGYQLKAIVRALYLTDEMYTTETSLKIMMITEEMSRVLKTRQSTWRIFMYYRPVLEMLSVLK